MNKPSQVVSSSLHHSAFLRNVLLVLALLTTGSACAEDDPPSRIARLAYLAGNVTFAPAGDDSWNQASINRPLTTGDRLLTEGNARAAMDIDGGDLRIGSDTGFNFLNVDDRGTQIELSRGTLNWRVDRIADGQNNEVDTPTVAFVIKQPGTYKIVVADDGSVTTISILQGAGTVYGEGSASYPISGRQSWRFSDSSLSDIVGMTLSRTDDFDLWCNDRDSRARNTASNDYVSTEVVGYNDLADNGDWDNVAEYGNVWYPRTVAVGWAPYRYGHWAWVAPWGWTWIDDAPWGFAPFHYGRWVNVSNRWGWVPGPRQVRPVYCPAMVAFVGGSGWSVSVSSGQPIGWVPLGPRDVYRPWYHGSQRYFTNVNVNNVRNINRVQVNNGYNDYRGNRNGNVHYMNQSIPGSTTVVTRDVFSHGRPVWGAQVRVDHEQLQRAPSMQRNDLPAGRPGQGLQTSGATRAPSQEFTRPPISFRKPPQAALGVRGGNRNASPSFGDGRDTAPDHDSTRGPSRDNNGFNNGAANTHPAPAGAGNNAAPQAPQAPQRRENDPRWNGNTQRNDDQRQGDMPSSRFSPWGNRRGDTRPQQQDGTAAQPQTQPRDNDPRWNGGNTQRDNDQRQGNIQQPSRAPSWGNRGNVAAPASPQQDSAPVQAQPPAPVQQPSQGGNGDQRWNSNTRRNNDSAVGQTPQQAQPQAPQQPDSPIGRSPPRFGSSRPAQNAPAPEPSNTPPPAPREQPQNNTPPAAPPPQRPEPQNRAPAQNRPERQPHAERAPPWKREAAEPRN